MAESRASALAISAESTGLTGPDVPPDAVAGGEPDWADGAAPTASIRLTPRIGSVMLVLRTDADRLLRPNRSYRETPAATPRRAPRWPAGPPLRPLHRP